MAWHVNDTRVENCEAWTVELNILDEEAVKSVDSPLWMIAYRSSRGQWVAAANIQLGGCVCVFRVRNVGVE